MNLERKNQRRESQDKSYSDYRMIGFAVKNIIADRWGVYNYNSGVFLMQLGLLTENHDADFIQEVRYCGHGRRSCLVGRVLMVRE